jgi:hypothetical protein
MMMMGIVDGDGDGDKDSESRDLGSDGNRTMDTLHE